MDKDTFEPTLQVSRKKEENDNIFGLKFDLRYFFQKGLLTDGMKITNKRPTECLQTTRCSQGSNY